MQGFYAILLLIVSNIFMTFAWYGHLKLKEIGVFDKTSIMLVILFSWGIAFFEYCFMVPANRLGFEGTGGPFSLLQLKVIQEVITLVIFVIFSTIVFKSEPIKMNHVIGAVFLVLAVYFIFKK